MSAFSRKIIVWQEREGRNDLPWQGTRDPYRIWVSEIMLQQTQVAAVVPYFVRFMQRFPDVHSLARAVDDEVMQLWAGLGYYSRARNLHAAAQQMAVRGVPQDEASWRELKGVGPYTAAAIAAIAFNEATNVVDGNVERVMARLFALTEPLPAGKPRLKDLAAALTPEKRSGDYAQAVMDLGATICTPTSPKCMLCPWAENCRGRIAGIAETLPRKAPKAARPQKYGVAFSDDFGSGKTFGWFGPLSTAGQPISVSHTGLLFGVQPVGVPLCTPPGRL